MTPTSLEKKWFPFAKPVGARRRLVVCPHAGGGATAYRGLRGPLPDGIELWTAQYPGRETRMGDALAGSVRELAGSLAELLSSWEGNEVALFGHSLGAFVAFETARLLEERAGDRPEGGVVVPAHVFVSGREPPWEPRSNPEDRHASDDRLVELIAAMGGTPREVLEHKELMAFFGPIYRNDLLLYLDHASAARPRLGSPLTLLAGSDDLPRERLVGWQEGAAGPVSERWFEGGHFYWQGAEAALVAAIVEGWEKRGAAHG